MIPKGMRIVTVIIALALGAVVATACGGASSDLNESAAPEAPSEEASVQLSWLHNIEFVGFYEAIEQGYYANQNLEVEILNGGFDADGNFISPVAQVVSVEADFGVAAADVLLMARAAGEPVVGVASIYQRSPVVLISLAEDEIVRPDDLIGQRIATKPGSAVDVPYNALISALEIDREELAEEPTTDFSVEPLIKDETDVLLGFITNEPIQMSLRGFDTNLILVSDYGIDIYSNVIFTRESMIEDNPDIVSAFVNGTLQGMEWAVENPELAADHVMTSFGDMMPPDMQETQEDGMLSSLPLMNPAQSKPGRMIGEAWETAHDVLLEQGLLDESVDVDEIYTTEFVDAYYETE